MSLMHYIAANREMPLGEFGSKKVKEHNKQNQLKKIIFLAEEKNSVLTPLQHYNQPSDVDEDVIDIYEKFEDAAGIYVCNVESDNEDIKTQFKNRYVYAIYPNFGSFSLGERFQETSPEMYRSGWKCLNELFKYIRMNSNPGEEVEIYSCWYGESSEIRNECLCTEIELSSFKLENGFKLMEGQYILIRT